MGQNSFTWTCPGGVTKVIVENWASGAGGFAPGGGGGGGEYARKTRTVIPTTVYTVLTGIGGSGPSSQAGADTDFDSGSVLAKGGQVGLFFGVTGGLGGTGGVGDVLFDGGDGSVFSPTIGPGAGGGGSGGDSSAGNVGTQPAGAPAVTRGGAGGDGAAGLGPASPGTTPGGGGGAVPFNTGSTANGNGADGGCVIWDDTANLGWPGVTVNPPLASFGSTPPPPPPPFNPKARKTVSII